MPRRSRSRSPRRERRSSRERRRHRKSRSRSRSPRRRSRDRHRSRSKSPRHKERRDKDRHEGFSSKSSSSQEIHDKPDVKYKDLPKEDLQGLPEEEAEMMRLMGFGSFDTTKGKKVEGNDIYCANVPKKRRYRQYMNRRGGFNRPLDFIA